MIFDAKKVILPVLAISLISGCKPAPSSFSERPTNVPEAKPTPAVDETPSNRKLMVGPTLDEAAKEAGIYWLSHRAKETPVRQEVPSKGYPELLVLSMGEATPLPRRDPKKKECGLGVYAQLDLHLKDRSFFVNHYSEELEGAVDPEAGMTPKAEWEGMVLDLWRCGKKGAPSFFAFGRSGLANYAVYKERYLPWRSSRVKPPGDLEEDEYLAASFRSSAIIAGDVDGDGPAELVIFYQILWPSPEGGVAATADEIGVVRGDGSMSVITEMSPMMDTFPSLRVVPAALNGGNPLLLSTEHCCGGGGFRTRIKEGDGWVEGPRETANGDQRVFVVPSGKEPARFSLVAAH